jgi:protoheme IX farnesyltransferase
MLSRRHLGRLAATGAAKVSALGAVFPAKSAHLVLMRTAPFTSSRSFVTGVSSLTVTHARKSDWLSAPARFQSSDAGSAAAPAAAPAMALSGTGAIPVKATYSASEVSYILFLLKTGLLGQSDLPPALRADDADSGGAAAAEPVLVPADVFLHALNTYVTSLPSEERHGVFQREYNRYHYAQANQRFGGNSIAGAELNRLKAGHRSAAANSASADGASAATGAALAEPEVVLGTFRTNFVTGEVEFSDPTLFRVSAAPGSGAAGEAAVLAAEAAAASRFTVFNSGLIPEPKSSFDNTITVDVDNEKSILKQRKIFDSIDVSGGGPSAAAATAASEADAAALNNRRSRRTAAATPAPAAPATGADGAITGAEAAEVAAAVISGAPTTVVAATDAAAPAAAATAATAARAPAGGLTARELRERAIASLASGFRRSRAAAAGEAAAEKTGFMSTLAAHVALTKPRISLMVAVTAWWGYFMAVPHGGVDYGNLTALTLGTLSLAATASIINQVRETDVDARMARTAARPLVTGKLSVATAKRAALLYGLAGTALLTAVDPIAAGLGVLNVFLYAGVYTSLKRITRFNTDVGAVVGAVPPMMGYAAALPADASFLSYDPIALLWPAAVMVAWQMQHVMLICMRRADDYNRSGLIMECFNDPALMRTRTKGVAWAIVTTLVVGAPYWAGYSDIRHIFLIYMWGVYTALYTSGALSKIPKQKILLMALYMGYILLGATLWLSVITKKKSEEDKYNQLMLNV